MIYIFSILFLFQFLIVEKYKVRITNILVLRVPDFNIITITNFHDNKLIHQPKAKQTENKM